LVLFCDDPLNGNVRRQLTGNKKRKNVFIEVCKLNRLMGKTVRKMQIFVSEYTFYFWQRRKKENKILNRHTQKVGAPGKKPRH
jgi:hypothetical protein